MKLIMFAIMMAALAGISSDAFAQSVGEKAASALGMTPSAESFVKTAAISNMFEIESSKLAQERTSGKQRGFATKMVSDHSKTTAELKAIAVQSKLEVPSAMDSSHQSKLDKLKGLKGEEFNKQYPAEQVAAHKDAVSLFERYAKGGDNKALKGFAAKYLPHLKQHLQLAEKLPK